MRLAASAVTRGYRLDYVERLQSTNDEALARARAGAAGRVWIVAAEQSGGRGRLGRVWQSPRGNLHASLLLIDPAPAALAPRLGFVVGVALVQALAMVIGPDPRPVLKWPNDVLLGGAKLAGILLEATQTAAGSFACVIGVGVNCVAHPNDLPYPATDLAARGVADGSAEHVFEAFSATLPEWLDIWDDGRGFAIVRDAWLGHAAALGQNIEVAVGPRRLSGVFRGIDDTGRLVLGAPTGDMLIDAGDVFLGHAFQNDAHVAQGKY